MNNALHGLATINVELTNRCNKNCWMCGRRKVDREYPDLALNYGDMDFALLEKIASQLPQRIVVQFHRDGEALLYPQLGAALRLFPNNIRNIVTNGKLLVQKADEIIDNIETLSVSIFEGDCEAAEQMQIIEEFLRIKKDRKPHTTLRLIGDVNPEPYRKFGLLMVRRVLHAPMGSFDYVRQTPTIPEIGICWDYLGHPCISRTGDFSICVRFDPAGLGVLGNIRTQTISEMWNSPLRESWTRLHVSGKRSQVPLCSQCEYWGVPISPPSTPPPPEKFDIKHLPSSGAATMTATDRGGAVGQMPNRGAIKMIATDIDGVLTDGRVTVSADGTEAKQISYRDLDAIGMGRRAGYEFAFITGEDSPMAQFFARRFGVQRLYAGTKDKLTALTALAHTEGIPLDAVLYIGDTDRDVPAMIAAGIGAAPADASPKALAAADIVTRTCGGTGVLYEIVSNLVDGVWVQR